MTLISLVRTFRFRMVGGWLVGVLMLLSHSSAAQTIAGCETSKQWTIERIGANHLKLVGEVEVECGTFGFFADQIELFLDSSKLVATGNVVFVSSESRIGADRAEFDTKTRTGTFFNAAGSASLGQRVDRSMFGTQEPDAYFYGQTIQKLGQAKYRISKGGFTTCVQPTPRWEIVSNSVTLNLDHYAILKNSILKVKGVPMFYMPLMYYPMQKDDRATGFLIPAYGSSTIRGQSLSNAFFWAINRSHDATLFHDWFTRTGQGMGGEYRYVLDRASQGYARFYSLNEKATTYVDQSSGTAVERTSPARRSYQIRASATQSVGTWLRARGSVDYFSDITVQQLYNQNIYEASRRTRNFGMNAVATRGPYSLSGTFERNETFFGDTDSALYGGSPRIGFTRGQRPLGGTPIYVSLGSEYVRLLRRSQSQTRVADYGLDRFDVFPLIRIPFTKWPFLTVNSSIAWRMTHWSESKDESGTQVPQGINRRYFDLQAQVTGPVFTRIWTSPGKRFKHLIEPGITIQRVTAVDNFANIVQLESLDSIVGNMTRLYYGLGNRFYVKPRTDDRRAVAREIINVSIGQSYYTDARAAQYDRQYQTSFSGVPPSHFSPVSLVARFTPTNEVNGTLRAEYDTQFGALRSIAADGTFAHKGVVQTTAGWSQRRFIAELPGFNDPTRLDHYLNQATTLRTPGNRVGGVYSFNYDVLHGQFLQQRFLAYYNAQCCGIAFEYQKFNFSGLGSRAVVPQDRRINFSFTLAGVGSFSNFFGALGGAQR